VGIAARLLAEVGLTMRRRRALGPAAVWS